MAQLFFKYGTMNSGKSTEILKVAHTYKTQGKKAYLLTSRKDTRTGVGRISSRIGLEEEAQTIGEDSNVYELVVDALDKEESNGGGIDVVLVDETQFLNREHIIQLTQVVDDLDLPVLCFGLKNDFSNRLFEGSEALLIYADKIEEIKNVCQYCNKKATMNIRLVDGKPVYEGEQIQVGGNESYQSVCRKCYNKPRK